jgi:hypothetical protein
MGEPSIAAQVVALQRLNIAELRERWKELTGEETTQRNRAYLVKRCAWELQRQHFGGELSPEAKARLHELQEEFRTTPPTEWFRGARHNRAPAPSSTKGPPPVRAAKAPKVGTVLARDYKGQRVTVTVRGDREFEYRGEIYRSLSAVAAAVTGSHCSGVAFFKASNRKEDPR